jgi:integrase
MGTSGSGKKRDGDDSDPWQRGVHGAPAGPGRLDRRHAVRPGIMNQLRSGHASSAAGLDPHDWTPRELRHSFVSLLSDADVPIEQISRLVGHSSSTTTETVYRKQIRPVIVHGADVMDRIR